MMKPTKQCSIDGCEKLAKAKGWCGTHYQANKRFGNPLGMRAGTKVQKPVPKKKAKSKASVVKIESTTRRPIDRNDIYNMAELAKLFQMSNRALGDAASKVRAAGEVNGRLAYSLPEVARAVWGYDRGNADEDDRYAGMKPVERKAQIDSEIKEVELKSLLKQYTHTDETHMYLAEKFKALDLILAILPDNIEREAGLSPYQLTIVDREIDKARRLMIET